MKIKIAAGIAIGLASLACLPSLVNYNNQQEATERKLSKVLAIMKVQTDDQAVKDLIGDDSLSPKAGKIEVAGIPFLLALLAALLSFTESGLTAVEIKDKRKDG